MKYLFCFGYETPDQFENNRLHGWDDEDSQAVWVEAGSKDEAMAAGYRYAQSFIQRSYLEAGRKIPFEWKVNTYSCWIEDDPEKKWPDSSLESLGIISE